MTAQVPVRNKKQLVIAADDGAAVTPQRAAAAPAEGPLPSGDGGLDERLHESPSSAEAVQDDSSHEGGGPDRLRTWRVGDLARRTGKTVRALHLYEELGLLSPIQRSSGGYRLYTRDAELRVRWIETLQQMGFSLTDIKQIAQDVERSRSAPDAMQRVQDLFREKLQETREQLRRLRALEGELEASLAYLETCDHCETEELLGACASCALHDCGHKTPELVLGFRVH
jgi:DNA-binding transcriptional MerR regulator